MNTSKKLNTSKTTKIFLIVLLSLSPFLFSQKYLDATIIKNNNDTINYKIKIFTNIFYKNLINESSFYRTVILVDENGKKIEKIKAIDIKELKFTDLEGQNRIYLNGGKALKQLVYDGKKIKWYRNISQNLYDGSIQYFDYLIDNEGKEYKMGLFNNSKKKLIEATKSNPELENEIENTKMTYENILLILKKYDEK